MVLSAFRHGLRTSELCGLQWADVEFESVALHLRRAKVAASDQHVQHGAISIGSVRSLEFLLPGRRRRCASRLAMTRRALRDARLSVGVSIHF